MLINECTAIHTDKVFLVPYCHHHVTTYHDWMKDPDIRVATASEPLSLEEEYDMQQSWRSDPDKLTFIMCVAPPDGAKIPSRMAEIASMIGDVNMFVSAQETDSGELVLVGELELMIASKQFQRRGLGRSALLIFLNYILSHEQGIVQQFTAQSTIGAAVKTAKVFDYFAVKINEDNGRSLSLFEGLGFKKTDSIPNFFGEYELRHQSLSRDWAKKTLEKYDVQDYHEIQYGDETANTG